MMCPPECDTHIRSNNNNNILENVNVKRQLVILSQVYLHVFIFSIFVPMKDYYEFYVRHKIWWHRHQQSLLFPVQPYYCWCELFLKNVNGFWLQSSVNPPASKAIFLAVWSRPKTHKTYLSYKNVSQLCALQIYFNHVTVYITPHKSRSHKAISHHCYHFLHQVQI